MSSRWAARAPGKVNLTLLLGPVREDGLHEIASLIEPVTLADDLVLEPAPAGAIADEVICPQVPTDNLAGRALAAYRERTGWDGPPQRLTIDKRIPIAGGMAGGSADAAGALRLVAQAAWHVEDPVLAEVAFELGADVPSQLRPSLSLLTGAGEEVEPLGDPPPHAVLVVPLDGWLHTAEVYREADRLGLARSSEALASAWRAADDWIMSGTLDPAAFVNDLEPAARALCPLIDPALEAVLAAGADHAMVTGSGPTVIGLFGGAGGREAAERAAAHLRDRYPRACAALPPPGPTWADPRILTDGDA